MEKHKLDDYLASVGITGTLDARVRSIFSLFSYLPGVKFCRS